MNSQKKLGNGVCNLRGCESYQMELWGITETASFQTLIFKIITTAIHKPFMLGFRHLESLHFHNCGLGVSGSASDWLERGEPAWDRAGHCPLHFLHFLVSSNEETKGRLKEGKWLAPGNKLTGVQGEATDLGLAPDVRLGRVELKANHNFLQSCQIWLQKQMPSWKPWNDVSFLAFLGLSDDMRGRGAERTEAYSEAITNSCPWSQIAVSAGASCITNSTSWQEGAWGRVRRSVYVHGSKGSFL